MEPLFNNLRSITLRLKKGLHTPNPSNPEKPMWTLEDLDEIAEGSKRNIEQANKHLDIFPRGYQGLIKYAVEAIENQETSNKELIK